MIIAVLEKMDQGLLSLLLAICGVAIMLVLLRRHQFRSVSRRDVGREQLSRLRDQQRLHQSMDELLIQLEEMSRRVSAQVDTKYAILEQVIHDADERIDRLERLLGRREVDPIGESEPPDSALSAAEPSAPPPPSDTVEISVGPNRSLEPAPEPENPRLSRVYELVDAGRSPIQAAEELEMPLGEVELILNLRQYR